MAETEPIGDETPMPEVDPMAMGDEPMPSDDMSLDMGDDVAPEEEPVDMGMEPEGESHLPGSFRLVQKLLGKMTQKMRDLADEDKLTDKNIKYVINTILSAVDLSKLSQDDKDDIIAKFEEEDMEDMEMNSDENDMNNEPSIDMGDEDTMDSEPSIEVGEGSWPELASRTATNAVGQMMKKRMGYEPQSSVSEIMDGIFAESKVDKILTKYFKKNSSENTFLNEQNLRKEEMLNSELDRLSESQKQFDVSKRLTENIKGIKFIGKTNKGNLIFEKNNKQIKVNSEGRIYG
jgi:hypothetical protein